VLLSRSPLAICFPKKTSSLDLHALGAPPMFVLSQDQTLKLTCVPSIIQGSRYSIVKVCSPKLKTTKSINLRTTQLYISVQLMSTEKL
ncbi:uncharacterized protein METZ01_LOCUS404060, partial [marine metagenome]